jgi:hypothetical protein
MHISHNIIPVNAMGYACKFYGCSQLCSIHICMNTVCMNGFSRGFPGPSVIIALYLANPHNYCGSIFAADSAPHPFFHSPFPAHMTANRRDRENFSSDSFRFLHIDKNLTCEKRVLTG